MWKSRFGNVLTFLHQLSDEADAYDLVHVCSDIA